MPPSYACRHDSLSLLFASAGLSTLDGAAMARRVGGWRPALLPSVTSVAPGSSPKVQCSRHRFRLGHNASFINLRPAPADYHRPSPAHTSCHARFKFFSEAASCARHLRLFLYGLCQYRLVADTAPRFGFFAIEMLSSPLLGDALPPSAVGALYATLMPLPDA